MDAFLSTGTLLLTNIQHFIFFILEWVRLFFEILGILVILIGVFRAWYKSAGGMFSLQCTIKEYSRIRK